MEQKKRIKDYLMNTYESLVQASSDVKYKDPLDVASELAWTITHEIAPAMAAMSKSDVVRGTKLSYYVDTLSKSINKIGLSMDLLITARDKTYLIHVPQLLHLAAVGIEAIINEIQKHGE